MAWIDLTPRDFRGVVTADHKARELTFYGLAALHALYPDKALLRAHEYPRILERNLKREQRKFCRRRRSLCR